MDLNKTTRMLPAVIYLLALASFVFARAVKAFTLSEALAVASFLCGLGFYLLQRGIRPGVPLTWSERLLVTASVIGLAGLPVKAAFMALGIGEASHDMASHGEMPGNPLLLHVHHLFYNIGFLILLVSAIVRLTRRQPKHGKPGA
jgi:hypothetical protein